MAPMIKADDKDFANVLYTEQALAAPKIIVYRTTTDVRFTGIRQTDPIVDLYLLRNGVTPLVAVDESKAPLASQWLALYSVPALAMLGSAGSDGKRQIVKRREGMFTANQLDEFAELPVTTKPRKNDSLLIAAGLAALWWMLK